MTFTVSSSRFQPTRSRPRLSGTALSKRPDGRPPEAEQKRLGYLTLGLKMEFTHGSAFVLQSDVKSVAGKLMGGLFGPLNCEDGSTIQIVV